MKGLKERDDGSDGEADGESRQVSHQTKRQSGFEGDPEANQRRVEGEEDSRFSRHWERGSSHRQFKRRKPE